MPSTSFFEFDGVLVDLCERELLAQLVSLPLVRVQVNRFRVDKCLVEAG